MGITIMISVLRVAPGKVALGSPLFHFWTGGFICYQAVQRICLFYL